MERQLQLRYNNNIRSNDDNSIYIYIRYTRIQKMKLIKNRTAKRHQNEKWNSKTTIMIR